MPAVSPVILAVVAISVLATGCVRPTDETGAGFLLGRATHQDYYIEFYSNEIPEEQGHGSRGVMLAHPPRHEDDVKILTQTVLNCNGPSPSPNEVNKLPTIHVTINVYTVETQTWGEPGPGQFLRSVRWDGLQCGPNNYSAIVRDGPDMQLYPCDCLMEGRWRKVDPLPGTDMPEPTYPAWRNRQVP